MQRIAPQVGSLSAIHNTECTRKLLHRDVPLRVLCRLGHARTAQAGCHNSFPCAGCCPDMGVRRTAMLGEHTLALCVSQSGQTFPTLHATRLLQQQLPGRVFICSR